MGKVTVIAVPKTPKRAFDPTRKASQLLQAQVKNLEMVTGRIAGTKPKRRARTEAQAALYIAEMTAELHPAAAHTALPAATPRRRPATKRKKSRTAKRKSR